MPDNLEELDKHVYIYCLCPSNKMLKGMMYMASLLINGILFSAQNCSRSTKRDSSVCKYKDNEGFHYGRILAFVKMNPPSAVLRPFSANTTQSHCCLEQALLAGISYRFTRMRIF